MEQKIKVKSGNNLILFFWLLLVVLCLSFRIGLSETPEWLVSRLDNPAPGYIKFDQANEPFFFLMDNYGIMQYQDFSKVKYYSMDFKILPNGNWGFLGENYLYIMTQSLDIIDSIPFLTDALIDPHDFQLLSNGHYLMLYQDEIRMNMSQLVDGGDKDAIVLSNFLIETDREGIVYWRWDAKNHYNIKDITPDIDLTDKVIDFTHINSFTEDKDGNIIISVRNLDEIAKINKSSGSLMWRLGGSKCKNNQFQIINDTENGFTGFSHQHSISILENGNILLFDNGNMKDPQYSRAVEYEINQSSKKLNKVWEYKENTSIFAEVMGSVQRLANGNTLINWGDMHISEVRKDNTIAFEMKANPEYTGLKSKQYRVYKYVTKMQAASKKIDKAGVYDFNDSNKLTDIILEIGSLKGVSETSVEKHYYCPEFAAYNDTNFSEVLPYRWVFSHSGINSVKGTLKIKTSSLGKNFNPSKMTIYKRNSENYGSFEPLNTAYNQASGIISAEFNELGEFVVCSNVLNAPSLSYPADKTEGTEIRIELMWPLVSGASKYLVHVSKTQDFNGAVYSKTCAKQNIAVFDSLLYNTSYYWRLRASNSKDTTKWSPVWSFKTKQVPKVKLLFPEDKYDKFAPNDTLKWAKINGPVYYKLQLSDSESFAHILFDTVKLSNNYFHLKNTEPGKKYYWRVMAFQDSNSGLWSDCYSFGAKPAAPVLSYPPNDTVNLPRQGILSWAEIAGATGYILQISDNINFKTTIINSPIKTNKFNYALLGGKWYYWRVKAILGTDSTDWSATGKFNAMARGPELKAPENKASISQDTIQFVWKPIGSGAVYRLQVAFDEGFGSILLDTGEIRQDWVALCLPKDKTFFWRVSGAYDFQQSEWSDIRIINTGTDSILQPPIILTPFYYYYYDVIGTVKWKKVDRADSYRLQISPSNDFGGIIKDTIIELSTEYNYFGLRYNSSYYIRIKSYNGADSSIWSMPARLRTFWNFVVLIKPADNELMVPINGSFTWGKPYKADFYQLHISTNSEFSDTVLFEPGIRDTVYNYTGLKMNSKYYWKVRNVTGLDTCNWSFGFSFYTTTDEVLNEPVIILPKYNQNKVPTDAMLQWEEVPGASFYKVLLSRSSDFGFFNYQKDSIEGTSCVFEGLRNDRYYYWKVAAFNSSAMSAWSQTGVFLTELKQPAIVFPEDMAVNIPTSGKLAWTKSADSVGYNVIISSTPEFIDTILTANILNDTVFYFQLKASTAYYCKVAAFTHNNASRWSNISMFKTLGITEVFEKDISENNIFSPVPAGEVLFINKPVLWGGELYRIYTITGSVAGGGVIEGNSIYTGFLNPGVYYLKINDLLYKFVKQ